MKRESASKTWDLIAAGHPHRNKKEQIGAIEHAESIGNAASVRKKPWQVVGDPLIAIDIIGLDCLVQGEGWLDKHPTEKKFLQSHGFTEEQAIALHEKWKKELYKRFGRDEKGREISNGDRIDGNTQ